MFLIEYYNKIGVQWLLWIFEIVVILNLHWKENLDTLTIVVIDQTYLCVIVVDKPLQDFYAGKYWSYDHYHVQVRPSDIRKKFIFEIPHIGVDVRGTLREFFPLDLLEKFFLVKEYHLGPYASLYVSKG